jgi:hypothetical protein
VREAVLTYAQRRNWTVVPYESYVNWAVRVADSHDQLLVLDPLFPVTRLNQQAEPLRISRVGAGYHFEVGNPVPFRNSEGIGILDDVSSSGATLEFVLRTAQHAGNHVALFAVCASTKVARIRLQQRAPRATWREYVPGDWIILHLRDGCPYLPFAGRRVGQVLDAGSDANLEVRIQPIDFPESPWHSLSVVRPITEAIASAKATILQGLTRSLDRPPVVQDLRILGAHVPALTRPSQHAEYTSRLDALLPSV